MKKKLVIGLSVVAILVLGFFAFAWYAVEYETYNESPCSNSAESFLDSLRKEYDIWSWWEYPRNFCDDCADYDPTLVECGVIISSIRMKEPELDFQQDTLLKKIAQRFWSFPLNAQVDTLRLTIENTHKSIFTLLPKDAVSHQAMPIAYDSIYTQYDFNMKKGEGTDSGGGGDYERYTIKTRRMWVTMHKDLGDYAAFADSIYQSELPTCKKDNIATFYVIIKIQNPKGYFTKEKTVEYRFEVIPFHEYNKKKNPAQ